MFDLGTQEEKEEREKHKYQFEEYEELPEKELLSMEKEMLGIYISGHPLEKLRQEIEKQTNINTIEIEELLEQIENGEDTNYKDGQTVKYAGIISNIKKKYTKNNTLMAFVTIEDLYGTTEVIVFESCYQKSANYLMVDNVVLVTGRLSIREDTNISIVANDITELTKKDTVTLKLDITGLDEETKEKLRGAIRFFTGERNNLPVQIIDGEEIKPCGGIFSNRNTIQQFKDILGEDRVKI